MLKTRSTRPDTASDVPSAPEPKRTALKKSRPTGLTDRLPHSRQRGQSGNGNGHLNGNGNVQQRARARGGRARSADRAQLRGVPGRAILVPRPSIIGWICLAATSHHRAEHDRQQGWPLPMKALVLARILDASEPELGQAGAQQSQDSTAETSALRHSAVAC